MRARLYLALLAASIFFVIFSATPANAGQAGAAAGSDQLPAGPGRDMVAAKCSLCHTLERVVSTKRSKSDWERIVSLMWTRRAPFSPEDEPAMVDYLYANFGRPDLPPRPARASIVLPAEYATYDFSQPAKRGTLTGTVTADQGQVHAFSVMAHNLLYRVRYMVYTKDGRYTVPQALPGPYEVYAAEYGYSSSTMKGDLKPGGAATVDLPVTRDAPQTGVTYVDLDTVYPPATGAAGRGRELYMGNCIGCHANEGGHFEMQLTQYGYRMGVEMMRWGRTVPAGNGATPLGRTQFSTADMDAIGLYLGSILDPNVKRVLRRPDYPIDENITSKAIFVEYDLPDAEVKARGGNIGFHDAFMAADGSAWEGSGAGGGVMIRLDPKEQDPAKRMKFFGGGPNDPKFGVNGIAEDRVRHHIYFSDTNEGELGEADPATGKITLHEVPMRGFTHSVYGDSRGNIWLANIYGGAIVKYDPATGHMSSFPTLTEDLGPYGVTEDHKGNIWVAGVTKGIIARFDPETDTFTEYKTPTPGAGAKRIRADSKDIMWFSEAANQAIGRLDPATGKITEYSLPVRNISPYSVWVDKKDESIIWASDLLNKHAFSPFSFDTRTKKMNYYPGPPNVWAPETFTESNNTEWMIQRSNSMTGSGQVHFYPTGYTADAPPEP
jgi:streptogramin lyase/mono/diheme cytochrome c family protein